ncbi:MAG: 4-hydroxybenzoate octaprenyltransferase [Pseudomonadota bacterium]
MADAAPGNWVDRAAPRAVRPYLRLSRIDRPIGTWLLLLPCWWALGLAVAAEPALARPETVWIAVGCLVGAFLMRGAGCTWNDYTDRDIDDKVARTRARPIPAGDVTPRQALIWMVVQALLAFLILLTFAPLAIVLGVASLGLVCIYPFAKRFTWWPQLFLGLAFNWGALLAWAAQTGTVPLASVLLYGAGIAWTLFYDTIYAHQDREDDALIGVRSTARLFGRATQRWLFVFLASAVTLMGLAVLFALVSASPLVLVIALAGVWAFGWSLAGQIAALDIDDAAVCWRLFLRNRDTGLLPAAAFAVAALAAIML